MKSNSVRFALRSLAAAAMLSAAGPAFAHCDRLDGPVVKSAEQSLADGQIDRVLIWVAREQEAEVRDAFARARAVRQLGPEARALADRFFFETVVRVHRAGEGAPYSGLKPAGQPLPQALVLADRAVETGKLEPVSNLLAEQSGRALGERFEELRARKNFKADDLQAGRAFVAAYVRYIHTVEAIDTASTIAPGHAEAHAAQAPGHKAGPARSEHAH